MSQLRERWSVSQFVWKYFCGYHSFPTYLVWVEFLRECLEIGWICCMIQVSWFDIFIEIFIFEFIYSELKWTCPIMSPMYTIVNRASREVRVSIVLSITVRGAMWDLISSLSGDSPRRARDIRCLIGMGHESFDTVWQKRWSTRNKHAPKYRFSSLNCGGTIHEPTNNIE